MNTHALIYGTIAIDTLITPTGRADTVLGGSASYAALAARLLTQDFSMLGIIGNDFPQEWESILQDAGVSMAHINRAKGRTFAWTGKYEQDMNIRETVETIEGVQEGWKINIPASHRESSIAVACNVKPSLQWEMLQQCSRASFSMADFMKSWILRERDYVDKLLSHVDLALMNDEEAACFANTSDHTRAGNALLNAGPRFAIIKHGSKGSTLFHRESGEVAQIHCPAWVLENPIDPTGAGDAYMGALAAHLVSHAPSLQNIITGMRYSSIIAAAACESFGTSALIKTTPEQIKKRFSTGL